MCSLLIVNCSALAENPKKKKAFYHSSIILLSTAYRGPIDSLSTAYRLRPRARPYVPRATARPFRVPCVAPATDQLRPRGPAAARAGSGGPELRRPGGPTAHLVLTDTMVLHLF